MKKAHRVLFLLLLPLLIEFILSCCNCPETASILPTKIKTICNIALHNLDNSGEVALVSDSTSFSKLGYGIEITLNVSDSSCNLTQNTTTFLSKANAVCCHCGPEFLYKKADSLIAFNIITKYDFDENHVAGSDISDLFYSRPNSKYINAKDNFVSNTNRAFQYYDDYVSMLLLMSPPTIGSKHEFEVIIELSDNRILRSTSGEIELK